MKVRLQEEEDLGGDDDPSKVGHVSKSLKSLSSAVLNLLYYVLCSNDKNWILHPLIKIRTFNFSHSERQVYSGAKDVKL